jgi:SAM-dependent methyltransferase
MTTQTTPTPAPAIQDQAAVLMGHLAGYVGHRTVSIGLRAGLFRALADSDEGLTPAALGRQCGVDPFYAAAWCRAANAAGLCERGETPVDVPRQRAGDHLGGHLDTSWQDARYRLAPHVATLLLDTASPAYVGGVFGVLEQPEVFDRFEESLPTGARTWWEHCSHEFIARVAGTGGPFYTRLVPGGLAQVPGLTERLEAGCTVLDHACGAGTGLVRLARTYPSCTVVGVDGDAYSVELARTRLAEEGLDDRVTVHHSPLEDLDVPGTYTLVTNNISMHECRDAEAVTEEVRRVLEPGGWFVVSDMPFPEDDATLRTPPGRIMSGIQLFEAQIDDQLVPRSTYVDLLTRHGFTGVDGFVLTPMHGVTYGRA